MIENREQACYWYKKSAEQGIEIAKEMLRYEGSSNDPECKKFEYDQNVQRWNKIANVFILEPISS